MSSVIQPSPIDRTSTVSIVALVAANCIPLFGAIYLHWTVFSIILLYWLENIIIGGFNVLRIAVADPDQPILWFAKLFLIPFFCIHFGMFTYFHGAFVLHMFGEVAGIKIHGLWPTLATVRLAVRHEEINFALFALFMSHAASFVWNYIVRGEFTVCESRCS